jgi:NAD(P)-dependent dehydrogenase (short-subunit alcohol dehydrogenase family)
VEMLRINAVLTGPLVDPDMPVDVRGQTGSTGRGIGGRLGTVDEVVDLVLFLCAEKSSFVHGTVFGMK